MRILVAISVFVLVVLLWATVSIVRHIRSSQRRSRFLRKTAPQFEAAPEPHPSKPVSQPVSEPTFADLAARALAASAIPISTQNTPPLTRTPAESSSPAGVSSARRAVASQNSSAGALGLIAQARKLSQDMPQPQIRPSGTRKAVEAAPEPQPVLELQPLAALQPVAELKPAVVPQPALEPQPVLRIVEIPQVPQATPVAAEPLPEPLEPLPVAAKTSAFAGIPFLRRPVRSVQPAPAFTLPAHRPDWVYFNKDMGDLSDPSPSRIRDRVRSR